MVPVQVRRSYETTKEISGELEGVGGRGHVANFTATKSVDFYLQ